MFMNKNHYRYQEESASDGGEAGGGEAGTGDSAGGESVDYKAQVEALMQEKESLSNKVNELLGETKKAKEARREEERRATQIEREKAEAEGNFEQLFQSSEKERAQLAAQLEELNSTIANKESSQAAYKIASSLAEGDNVELLSEFVQRRLKYVDGSVKVVDNDGNLTVSTLDDLKREFEGSARYASLRKGRQSSGGGASGGTNDSGSATETMSRADFDALNPNAKMSFIKKGGKVKQ